MLSHQEDPAPSLARAVCGFRRGPRPVLLAAGVLLLSVAACAKGGPSADSSSSTTKADSSMGMGAMKGMSGMGNTKGMSGSDTGAMAGMAGMSGDSGGMAGMKGMGGMSGMMGDMQKQMDAMMKLSPDQMKAMMPAHRQMAASRQDDASYGDAQEHVQKHEDVNGSKKIQWMFSRAGKRADVGEQGSGTCLITGRNGGVVCCLT